MKNQIDRLIDNYSDYISLPWNEELAPDQRVVFCIYPPSDELKLRFKMEEFKIRTVKSGNRFEAFDLKDEFSNWIANYEFGASYFKNPTALDYNNPYFNQYLKDKFHNFCSTKNVDSKTVICVYGVGSLFGITSVKETMQIFAGQFAGKLVVLFPGVYENNTYRLLDAYDGWNYLAVPITSEKLF